MKLDEITKEIKQNAESKFKSLISSQLKPIEDEIQNIMLSKGMAV